MHAIKVLSAISTVILSPLLWPIARIRPIRELRLQSLFNKDIHDYPLHGLPLVLKQPFVSDIEDALKHRGGVKLIWGPPGSGKSAAMRRVLNDMKERKLIRGGVVITPPDRYEIPSTWFRNALSDSFGNILYTNELLSKLIPKHKGEDWYTPPPYVIVLDQLECIPIDEHFERFIKIHAYDSYTTKSYVIFIICSDATKVSSILDAGKYSYITLLNTSHTRWSADDIEVDEWVPPNMATNPSTRILHTDTNTTYTNNTSTRMPGTGTDIGESTVRKAAVLIGTPSAIRMMASSIDRSERNMSSYNYHQYWDRLAEDDNVCGESGYKIQEEG